MAYVLQKSYFLRYHALCFFTEKAKNDQMQLVHVILCALFSCSVSKKIKVTYFHDSWLSPELKLWVYKASRTQTQDVNFVNLPFYSTR